MTDSSREEAAMEELHRIHKEVPFGWVLALQTLWRGLSRRGALRRGVATAS